MNENLSIAGKKRGARTADACAALLALLVAILYWPALSHQFINLDDDAYVTNNLVVKKGLTAGGMAWALGANVAANWHPLTWLSHMLDVQIGGLDPMVHHLSSLLLHAMTAALLFLALRSLTGAMGASLFVALLFAVHPLNVEPVAWIAQRKSVLAAFFWVLAMAAHAHYARRPSAPRYLVTMLILAVGLTAKPSLVTLPFALLLLDWWPLGRIGRQAGVRSGLPWLEKIPLLALVAASSFMTYRAQAGGGAVRTVEQFPLALRLANALLSCFRYLGKLLWPLRLSVFYPYPARIPAWEWGTAALFLVGLTLLVVGLRRRHPFLAFGWLWYLGNLVPVIGLVQVGEQAYADRYAYLPFIGLFVALAWSIRLAIGRWKRLTLLVAAVFVVCLAVVTWVRIGDWRDSETLFSRALAVSPDNWLAHLNLGAALDEQGREDEAVSHFRQALGLRPGFAEAHNNLGNILQRQRRYEEAIAEFRRALQYDPRMQVAWNNLAAALAETGREPEALDQYRQALALHPDNVQILTNLGIILLRQGKLDEAAAYFTRALAVEPLDPDAHGGLGEVLQRQGKLEAALIHFREAVRQRPSFPPARHNLALALAASGDLAAAVVEYRETLRFAPADAEVHNNLGVALAGLRQYDAAAAEFAAAVRLNPGFAEARANLVLAEAQRGRGAGSAATVHEVKP